MAQPPWKAWPPIIPGGAPPPGGVLAGILLTDGIGDVAATPLAGTSTPFATLAHPAIGHYVLTMAVAPAVGYATFGQNESNPLCVVQFIAASDTVVDVFTFDMAGAPIDSGFAVAVFDVPAFVAAADTKLLDNITTQPLWAHCLGAQIRTGQTAAFRLRRSSDNAEIEIGFVNGVTDLATIAAFCGAGDGALVTVHNAVAASPYGDISQLTRSKQALVYVAGAPVLGANGLLSARFNGIDTQYTRADSLGFAGDVACTLVGDYSVAANLDQFGAILALGGTGVPANPGNMFALDVFNGTDGWGECDYGLSVFLTFDTGTAPLAAWMQAQRAASAVIGSTAVRANNVPLAPKTPSGTGSTSFASTGFAWGGYVDGSFIIGSTSGGGGTSPILLSNAFVWKTVLSAFDQAALAAWQATHQT